MDSSMLVATMLVCFGIGMPIGYSLALAAIAGAWSIGIPLEAVMLKISDGVSKVAMLTIPFFVLAGAIMAEGGMARRLVAFADVLVGVTRVRGGLSVVNVLATTFLSGISGSAVADTSAIGSVMIPQMAKSGFPRGRGRRGRLRVGILRHHVHLSRLPLARPARARAPHLAHGGHGHDLDRLRVERRLRHGAHTDAGEDHRVLPDDFQRQERDPV